MGEGRGGRIWAHAFPTSSLFGDRSRHHHARHAERRDGRSHRVGEVSFCPRRAGARRMGLRRSRRAFYQLDYLPAHFGNSAVDNVLSLALFKHMGVGFLLFGDQLFDGRLWGCRAPTCVAAPPARRKCFRCSHLRTVGGLPVCSWYTAPAGQSISPEPSVSVAVVGSLSCTRYYW